MVTRTKTGIYFDTIFHIMLTSVDIILITSNIIFCANLHIQSYKRVEDMATAHALPFPLSGTGYGFLDGSHP